MVLQICDHILVVHKILIIILRLGINGRYKKQQQQNTQIQTHIRFRRMLFITTKHNMWILGVILFVNVQNNT